MQPRSTALLRGVTRAYRKGWIPARGYGVLFSRSPSWMWGGNDLLVETDVGKMAVPLRDMGALQLLTFGSILHERGETLLMRKLLPSIDVFFDIGANFGWYARLARDVAPNSVIVAAEANPRLLPYLRYNLGPGVDLQQIAVTDHAGEMTFHLSDNSALSSTNRYVGEAVTVAARTLDQISSEIGRVPDFVKCDVEGGELAVLAGATEIRSSAEPPIWLIEADETFLLETGSSYGELDRELKRFGPVSYYRAGSDGALIRLSGLEDLRGTIYVNVFVVPKVRQSLVNAFVQPH